MAKKNDPLIRRVTDIDEKELLESMGGATEKIPTAVPKASDPPVDLEEEQEEQDDQAAPVKETASIRKQANDFKSAFLSPRILKIRQAVYISREIHEKLCRIVNEIADAELTVGTYVDTILRQHLKKNKNEINALYKRERGDLI